MMRLNQAKSTQNKNQNFYEELKQEIPSPKLRMKNSDFNQT